MAEEVIKSASVPAVVINSAGETQPDYIEELSLDAIKRYGPLCTCSRFLNEMIELHEQPECELAEWVGKQAALVFSTGMQTNQGTISALVGQDDVVVLDKLDHGSFVDDARLGWGKIVRFRHNDMKHLECVLSQTEEKAGRQFGLIS